MQQKIYFVGTSLEVGHHAAPLVNHCDYEVLTSTEVIAAAKPGDLAIFYSEHFDRFRDAISKLKVQQVATLYMVDGILEWRNAWENRDDEPACPFAMRPVLCHKVACIGNAQARVLASWGNSEKIEVVGVPRFDDLASRQKPVEPRSAQTVLVMTAKFPSYTDEQHRKLAQSLRDLKSYFDSNPSINVLWRLTAGLDDAIGVESQLSDFTGNDLAGVLPSVDAVISTPSTAVLEAMLFGLPVAVIDYTNSPAYLPVAWNITAADQIDDELDELLNPSEAKLFFQQCTIRDALQLGEPATRRMGHLIQQMLAIAKRQIDHQKRMDFPAAMLSAPKTSESEFVHSEIYSSFAEFQTGGTVELQAELAHARREILHLQRQLKQIETELGQAHMIFDEINNHPIAGPVVRIRKRILSLLGKLKRARIQPEPQ